MARYIKYFKVQQELKKLPEHLIYSSIDYYHDKDKQ